ESRGAFQPSPDFTHMAFSSNNIAFAPNGLTKAPGSAYDYDAKTGSTTIISKTPDGADIPQEPTANLAGESISFPSLEPNLSYVSAFNPGVSTDGSHILMATHKEPTSIYPGVEPLHLYMRVNDFITYDVSDGHTVEFAGMTPDGKHVYFTSPEQLT